MFRLFTACCLLFLSAFPGVAQETLEARLQVLDAELETLAHLSLRSDSGSIGYRSQSYYADDHAEWVEIDLGSNQLIDEVVIVPVLRRYSKVEFKADGLPTKMLIRAGTPDDPTGKVIATVDSDLPRIAPLVVSIPAT